MAQTLKQKDWEEMGHLPVNDDKLGNAIKVAMVEPFDLAQSTAVTVPGNAVDQRILYTAYLARTGIVQTFTNTGQGIVTASTLMKQGTLANQNKGGVGIEFQANPEGWPVITSLAAHGRSAMSGLVEIGDVLNSVDDVPAKDMKIPDVVSRIVGLPGTRVKLELLRTVAKSELPNMPVMVEPFYKYQVNIQRAASGGEPPSAAGIGILLQRVSYTGFGDITTADGKKVPLHPVMVQALTANGSAYQSGQILPGDLILSINNTDIIGMAMPEVWKLLRGQAGTNVELIIERGHRHPYIFSHEDLKSTVKPKPGKAYLAPPDAYWVEIKTTEQPIGVHLDNYTPPVDSSEVKTAPALGIRSHNNINYESLAPRAKLITRIDANSPAANSDAFRRKLLKETLLLHAIDGMSVHGESITPAEAESFFKMTKVGKPVKLLVSKPPPPPPTPKPAEEKIVEKRVEVPVDKIVQVPVEKAVETIKYVDVNKEVKVPVEKIVEKIVEKRVEVPVDRLVEHPIEKIKEVPVDKIVEKRVEVPGQGMDRIIEVPVDRIVYQMMQPAPEIVYHEPVQYVEQPLQYVEQPQYIHNGYHQSVQIENPGYYEMSPSPYPPTYSAPPQQGYASTQSFPPTMQGLQSFAPTGYP